MLYKVVSLQCFTLIEQSYFGVYKQVMARCRQYTNTAYYAFKHCSKIKPIAIACAHSTIEIMLDGDVKF